MAEITALLCGTSFDGLAAACEARGIAVVETDAWARDLGGAPERGVSLALLDAEVITSDLNPVIERLAQEPGIWPVVVSSRADPALIVGAMRVGAVDFVHRSGPGLDAAALADRLAQLPEKLAGSGRDLGDEQVKVLRKFLHDVKNPINNILGYAELLIDNPTTKIGGEAVQFVERIRANGLQALEILRNFGERAGQRK